MITTQPGEGEPLADGQALAVIFDGYMDESSFAGRVNVRGSETGVFQVSLEHSMISVILRLSPKPLTGESITVTLADGIRNLNGDSLDGDENGVCGGDFVWSLFGGQQSSGEEPDPDPDPDPEPVDLEALTVAVEGSVDPALSLERIAAAAGEQPS